MPKFNPSYTGLRKELLHFIEGFDNLILDVGCANGANGKYLLEIGKASKVYGVEINTAMASEAISSYDKIFLGNLNDSFFLNEIISNSLEFDYIIFGDILEHLFSPVEVLGRLKHLLKENGKIIISLPNIAHLETFIQLYIKGTFPQNDRGIFDRTHIRWFTKTDALKLIAECELEVLEYIPIFRARDEVDSQFDWRYRIIRKLNKNLVTFQHLLLCSHAK